MAKNARINTRADGKLRLHIEQYAKENGVNVSEAVRRLTALAVATVAAQKQAARGTIDVPELAA